MSTIKVLTRIAVGYVAISLISDGWSVITKATYPVLFAHAVNSDTRYPIVPRALGGLGLVVVGFGLMLYAIQARDGSTTSRWLVFGALMFFAFVGAGNAISQSDSRRCVEDSYSGARECASRSWAATRDTLAVPVPLAATALAVLIVDRTPRTSEKLGQG